MEDLYIETKIGTIQIDKEIVAKYNLEKGTLTPFTNNRIVGSHGEFVRPYHEEERGSLNQNDDEIEEMENGLMLSTSEMIDIAQGADMD